MTAKTDPATELDVRRHKRSERDGYNLIAERYKEEARRREPICKALLDAAELAPGQALLDVASGPGVLARAAQARVAPGAVVISDLAERTLQLAQTAAPELLAVAADAEALPFAAASFDRVLCGLGLMFFPDTRRGLGEMLRVLRPQGRLALSVWDEPGAVPLVQCALSCMARLLPAPKVARLSPCRLGGVLEQTLAAAGCASIAISRCELDFSFDSAAEYWRTFLDMAGGAASGLSRLPAEMQARLAQEVAVELAPYKQGDGYRLVSGVLIATAGKPA